MKFLFPLVFAAVALVPPAFANVSVSSPANGATVSSPVTYAATATTTCAKGVSAMGIYVNNVRKYVGNGSSLNTSLALSAGTYNTVVQEWDGCGGSTATPIAITVAAAGGGGGGSTNGVVVTSPANNSTVSSPVMFAATAGAASCSKGVAAMGIYDNNVLKYKVNGAALNTQLALSSGVQHVVVQEWDNCGGSLTSSLTLTVQAGSAATTVSMTASPTSITAGGTSTLSVSAANATAVTVSGSDGSSYTLSTSGGTQAVHPAATTTYTAHATGAQGNATANATVTVVPAGATTVNMTASPTSITAGGSSTLSVSAANATAVTVSGSDGSSYTLATTGGTQAVHPAATTTYTAHATGAQANATASATVTVAPAGGTTTVSMTASPMSITAGSTSTLSVSAANATAVTISGNDGSSYTLATTGGTQVVSPSTTTTYTANATGAQGNASANSTVTVVPASSTQAIDHVIFMLQENHSFDNYFGMLNPYRQSNGWNIGEDGKTYNVDGIDDKLGKISNSDDAGGSHPLFKLKSTCVDDMTSAWLESYGDVSRFNFSPTRSILMDGFVHTAEGFAKSCTASGGNTCGGNFTDMAGVRSMGYYDQGVLNYYYYMASQFAVSDRWFSPVSSKSIDNRIATFTGGTTQGLVRDPGNDDHLGQVGISTIFDELEQANVSWKVYYSVTDGNCLHADECGGGAAQYPATNFNAISGSGKYLYSNLSHAACRAPLQESSVVGDTSNSFCIDTAHIAPLATYFTDLTNGTLPSFAFIEAGYGNNDEHPGSGQSVLAGQAQVANIIDKLMVSPEWGSSVFFLSYDEGGGPYDHVPPVPGHSNQNTDASLGTIPDISQIAVNPDGYKPCLPAGGAATAHCDLAGSDPGAHATDAAAQQGFAAQLGFRVPNIIVSPFARKHYVSHTPMDHTAILKFVENRFIGPSAHLTARDQAQPNLLEFFDFSAIPWSTPPAPPTPASDQTLGYNSCTPASMGP